MFEARKGRAARFGFISSHRRYRGEGILPASPVDVWECIKPVAGGLRTKWDQNVKDFEVIEVINDVSSLKTVLVWECSVVFRSAGPCTDLPGVQPVLNSGQSKCFQKLCSLCLDQSGDTGIRHLFSFSFTSL